MPRKTVAPKSAYQKNKNRYGPFQPYAVEADAEEKAKKEAEEKATSDAFDSVLANPVVNVTYGATDAVEGLTDFSILGPVMGTAWLGDKILRLASNIANDIGAKDLSKGLYEAVKWDNKALDTVADWWKYSATGDVFGKDKEGEGFLDTQWGNDISKQSADVLGKQVNGVAEQVSQGVGEMLPLIIATAASGGAAAPAAVIKGIQTAAFFAQAAGQSTEEALQRGATPGAALLYGVANGAVEAGTEWVGGTVFGELNGGLIGKIAPKFTNKLLSTGAGRAAFVIVSEGTEEVLSDVVHPLLDAGAGIGDLSRDTWAEMLSGLPETFAVGGTVGLLLNGISNGVSNIQNRSKGGSEYNKTIQSLTTIENALKANEIAKASSKKSQATVNKIETEMNKLVQKELGKISEEMSKMSAEQRAQLLEDAPVLGVFLDENGNVRSNIIAAMNSQISSGKASNTSDTVFDAKKEAANLAQVAQQVGQSVKVDNTELNPTERKNFASLLDANRQVNEFMVNSSMDDAKAKVVIYKGADSTIKGFTAPITLGNTVYISRSSLSDGTAIQKYIHEELGHQQGVSMDRAALSELSSDTELRNKAISDLANTDNQGYSAEEISEIISRGEQGEVLTGAEAKVFDEYGARLLEFGLDAKSISRITQENPTGLRKISSAISDFVESRKNRKLTDSERNRLQALRRAERNIRMSLENTRAARSEYFKDRSKYLSLDESERAKFLKDRGYTAEDFAPGVLEKEDVSTLPQKYREEYLAVSREETKKAAEAVDEDVKFSRVTPAQDKAYMQAVEKGDTETAQRMVDEAAKKAGYSSRMYHGSKRTDLKVLKDWQYFTEDQQYAERYARDGKVYGVFVKMEKPFDTRKAEAKKLFYEARNQYGMSELTDNGLPDWTDGYNLSDYIDEAGLDYDSIILNEGGDLVNGKPVMRGNSYVVRKSAQVKSADPVTYDDNGKVIPISERFNEENSDIRFSKVDPRPGQSKVYSKEDAADVISSIIAERMKFGDEHFAIEAGLRKGKTADATRQLFEYLNTLDPGERGGAALKLADYIVENAITTQVWDDLKVDDEILERDRDIVSLMNGLRHRIDFGPYKADIVHIYDKKRAQGMFLQWGTSQANARRAVGMDQIADLFDEIGVKIDSDQHPVEIFSRAMDLYDAAKDELGSVMGTVRLTKYLDEGQVEALKQDIAKDLLRAYDEKGEPSILKTRLDALKEELQQTKASAAAERKIAKVRLSVLRDLRFLRGATNRTYVVKNNLPISVNLLSNPSFQAVAKVVSSTMFGDRISPKRVREAMVGLQKTFLTEDNKIFYDWVKSFADESGKNPIIEDISNNILPVIDRMTRAIGDGETVKDLSDAPLTYAEWRAFRKVAALVKKVYTSYDAFYENGKRYVLSEKVRDWQQSIDFANKTRTGKVRFLDKTFDSFERSFVTPIAWAQSVDGYDPDGFFTHFVQKLTADSWLQQIEQQRIDKIVDDYIQNTKGYEKRLKERIPFDGKSGKKILRSEAIDIYLQSTQENGFLTLTAERGGGVYYTNERGEKSPDVLKYSAQSLQDLYNSFSQEDKDFIETVLKGYEEVGKLRRDANIRLMGFSDDVKGRYYPIFRDQGSIQRDPTTVASFMKDIATANNIGANKKRRAEALVIPLQARNVADKFYQHVRQLTMFSAFAEDLQNLRRAYGLDLSSTLGGKETIQKMLEDGFPIKTASGETKSVATTYFVKLLNDIQGVSARDTTKIDRIIRTARGNYAKATLNINIKVGLSQLASIPNAMQYIDPTVMARAAVAFRDPSKIKERMKDMDKYSQTAYIRTLTNVAMQSEALLDKMGNVTDKLGFLINFNDRMAIAFLWKCAQLQVAKDYGYKLGSEDNLKAAGELLDQINTNTQPTYQATDKSGFQRNQNELVKSFAMFKSVPTKQISMILSAYGEAFTLPRQIKYIEQQLQDQNISGDTRKALEAKLKDLEKRSKAAKGNAAKATVAVVLAQAMYTVLGSAVMRFILRKDDDKPFGESLLFGFINSLVSIVPIAGQLYDFFMNGRELSEVSVASVNTFLTDIGTVFNGMTSGKDEQTAKGFRNLAIDAGMISGVPVRNILNLFLGVVKSAAPETADRYSYAFTAPKTTDVAAAMQKGETALANDLTSRIMASKGFSISSEQASVLSDLVNKGYSLPSGTITQYTIDGTTYTLTEKERDNFALVYADAAGAADQVVSNSAFAKFSDDGKNKAISYIYSYYKDKAKVEAVGIDASKLYLFGTAIDPASLALVLAGIDDLLARAKASGKEYDRKALITEFLKRQDLTAAQKYMLMGYFGYKNTNGAEQVRNYINRLHLTKSEKQKLYEYCKY